MFYYRSISKNHSWNENLSAMYMYIHMAWQHWLADGRHVFKPISLFFQIICIVCLFSFKIVSTFLQKYYVLRLKLKKTDPINGTIGREKKAFHLLGLSFWLYAQGSTLVKNCHFLIFTCPKGKFTCPKMKYNKTNFKNHCFSLILTT